MKIQIGGLSEGIHRYQFHEPAETFGLGEHFSGELGVEATLERTGRQLSLTAAIQVTGAFDCDRCAAPFMLPINTVYHMYYVTEAAGREDADPMDIQVIPPGLSVIDLSEDVRQMTLLAVPLKLLCRDGCKGLCPRCGVDLNLAPCVCPADPGDERWGTLRDLRD